ncbi:MAG: AAA family ATPase [Aeriscardovia sp.]|nr:AAA family ATPase [Aeriscardovia sp.]
MKEIRIHIHDFGPLHEVEFQLAPMMIFTGMSSLGKSYANYVAYYTISSICGDALEKIVAPKFDRAATEQCFEITTREIESVLHNGVETYMQSFLGDDNIRCNVDFQIGGKETHSFKVKEVTDLDGDDAIPSRYKSKWEYTYNGETSQFYSKSSDLWEKVMFVVNNKICVTLFKSLLTYTPILPPARGAFVGENYTMKSKVSSSLGMYRQFLNDYDIGVQPSEKVSTDREKFFKKAMERLLEGQLVNEKDKQYLRLSNGQQIALTAAASSIKELSPFLFYLKNQLGQYMSFCFEEPEAHLHPKMQVALADLVAASLNHNIFFQFTTHSDYFLQRLNQLIKLGFLRNKNKDKFDDLCKEWGLDNHCYIEAKDVKAYFFHRNNDGMVEIVDLPIGDEGIPFKSFFDVANELQQREEEINNALYELCKKEDKE